MGHNLYAQEIGEADWPPLQSPHLQENLCLSIEESGSGHNDYKRLGQVGKLRNGAEVYKVSYIPGQYEIL